MYGLGHDKCPGRRRRHPPDAPSGAFTSTGRSAIQKGAGLERVLGRPVTTSVRPTVRTAAPRSSATTGQEPHADRRRQGTRRRTPLGRDLLEHQGRAALPPRPRRGHPRHRPRRAALHPGVPAARPAELRHRRGQWLARRHQRPVHARRRGRPRPRPARRPVPAPAPPDPGPGHRDQHRPHRRRVRQGQGGRPRHAHRSRRRRRPVVDQRRADLRTGRGRLGRRPRPLSPPRTPDGRAPQGGRASRPRGPGPPLPPLRRLEPPARRPRVRQAHAASTGPSCTACAPTA